MIDILSRNLLIYCGGPVFGSNFPASVIENAIYPILKSQDIIYEEHYFFEHIPNNSAVRFLFPNKLMKSRVKTGNDSIWTELP